MDRRTVTEMILEARRQKQLGWTTIADALGTSKEWATAACLGQMSLDSAQADNLVSLLDLPSEAAPALREIPYRGSLPTLPPTDPLIYRLHEVVSVYGTTVKELIQEEFGDGIMSAIDFTMDISREPDPAGDRVNITLSGKFLPYKRY